MIPEVQVHQPDPVKDLHFPGVFFMGMTGIYAKRSSFKQMMYHLPGVLPGTFIIPFTGTCHQQPSHQNSMVTRRKLSSALL